MNSIQRDKSLPRALAVFFPSGKLQFDLWGAEPKSGRWNWTELKAKIAEMGLRTLNGELGGENTTQRSTWMSCNLL